MNPQQPFCGEWQVIEYFGFDWRGQLVHRDLPEGIALPEEPLCVMDEEGHVTPAQLTTRGGTPSLQYVANLKPHARKTYRAVAQQAPPECPSPSLSVAGDACELSNETFAVRITWKDECFNLPIPLAQVAGPIAAIRGLDGRWIGHGSWNTDPLADIPRAPIPQYGIGAWTNEENCTGIHCEIIEEGPVFIELRQTYRLESGCSIIFTYLLDAVSPCVQVTQECDGTFEGAARFDIAGPGNFDPTHAFWRVAKPSDAFPERDALDWCRQVYELEYAPKRRVAELNAFHNWFPDGSTLWSCWDEDAASQDMLVLGGIRPSQTRCARWYRHYFVVEGQFESRRELAFLMPLQEGRRVFFIGIIGSEGALPQPGASSSPVERFYAQLQGISLDAYHHMTLDWPGIENIRFPRLMMRPEELPEIRNTYKDWPWLRERLEKHACDRVLNSHVQQNMIMRDPVIALPNDWAGAYLATGQADYARRAKEQVTAWLNKTVESAFGVGPTVDPLIGIQFARDCWPTAVAFDFIASGKVFTDEERVSALRRFAFMAEIQAMEDTWPKLDSGLNRGNANFHPEYLIALTATAGLLDGHPRQRQWLKFCLDEITAYIDREVLPSGCSLEAPTYQYSAVKHSMLIGTMASQSGLPNLLDTNDALRRSLEYFASIQTPPDPRTGFCMVPTIGHVTSYGWCQSMQVYLGWAARATAQSDPAFSQRMMAAWRRAGEQMISWHDHSIGMVWWPALCLLDGSLPGETDASFYESRLSQGLGAVFRTIHEDESQGYLLIKMGESIGHYNPDEGSLIWYAYGKPILADFGTQYNPMLTCAWLHNRISFGLTNERWGTWFDVKSHTLTDRVDYVCGDQRITGMQPYPLRPMRSPDYDSPDVPLPYDVEPFTWRRHVLYLKPCEAIVVLDEVDAEMETDFNLQIFANEARLSPDSGHFQGQFGVDLDVFFANTTPIDLSLSAYEHLGYDEPRGSMYWLRALRWSEPEGVHLGAMGEYALTLRARATTGPRYLALLRARPASETAPAVSPAAAGEGFRWTDDRGAWTVEYADGQWRVAFEGSDAQWREDFAGPSQLGTT